MTSVPVNSCARSSVDARPLSVRTSQVSTMGAILPPMVIALDVGTSSTRASLYDSAGHPIPGRMRQVPYEPTVTPDGGVEHDATRSEEHTSELQSPMYLVCRLLLDKQNTYT